MELYYNLLGTYAKDEELKKQATEEIQGYIDEEFLQESEVIEIATANDTCILVEVQQSDGYCETILVDNKGTICERLIFNLDNYEEARNQIARSGLTSYFNEAQMKRIHEFAEEYEMSLEEFQEELLDEFFMDEYDREKWLFEPKIDSYYK